DIPRRFLADLHHLGLGLADVLPHPRDVGRLRVRVDVDAEDARQPGEAFADLPARTGVGFHAPQRIVDHRGEHLVAIAEVLVEGPEAHAGALGDLGDRRVLETLLGEGRGRGLDQLRPRALGLRPRRYDAVALPAQCLHI